MVELIQSIVALLFGAVTVVVNACPDPRAKFIVLGSLLVVCGILGLVFYFTRAAKIKARKLAIAKAKKDLEEKVALDNFNNMKEKQDLKKTDAPAAAPKKAPAKKKTAPTGTVTASTASTKQKKDKGEVTKDTTPSTTDSEKVNN